MGWGDGVCIFGVLVLTFGGIGDTNVAAAGGGLRECGFGVCLDAVVFARGLCTPASMDGLHWVGFGVAIGVVFDLAGDF